MHSHVLTKAHACRVSLKMKVMIRLVNLLLPTCVFVRTGLLARTVRQVGYSFLCLLAEAPVIREQELMRVGKREFTSEFSQLS
jgi:hypothetical protein